MTTESQVRLYAVSNPVAFTNYNDHEAALFIRLHELIAASLEQGENPIGMIEDYLGITYNSGESVEEIATFLFQSGAMEKALWDLKDNWSVFDPSLPEASLVRGGLPQSEGLAIYQEITLKSYLETLSTIFDR
ncbi:hypothetical protein LVD17_00250 [Fulvivirga ulvae]|uniref:hypothetical protein n=1 Tax=Fulvivirga ulvae TaxID=2904245 RepID=UPI001F1D2BF7|nr:hypothetical protein [Fulvivirga ulvae]UII32267.1 hypothetical protein LVD17_00250 [Fulvivirga ulvae]